MGADQHYVPVFITKSFAGEGALAAVPAAPAAAREHYRRALQTGSSRTWPVLVFDKLKKGLVARPTANVCVARHLYSLPQFESVEATGVALSIIERFVGLKFARPQNDGELLSWARAVGGSGTAREIIEGKLNERIEEPAYKAVARILQSGRLMQADVRALALFLEFSMIRVPNWYEHNRAGLEASALRLLHGFEPIPVRREHFKTATEFLQLYERVAKRISYLTLLCTFLSDERRNDPLFARRKFRAVLFRAGGIPFIHCDNAARPMFLSSANRAHKVPAPGLREQGSFALYPLSPKYMLGFTADPTYMHLSTIGLDKRSVQRLNAGFLHLAVREVILPADRQDLFAPGVSLIASKPFVEVGNPMYKELTPSLTVSMREDR